MYSERNIFHEGLKNIFMTKLKNKVHILDHSKLDHFFLLFNVILYAYTVMLHIIYAIVHVTTLLCIVTEENWSFLGGREGKASFLSPPLETILLAGMHLIGRRFMREKGQILKYV